MCYDALRETMNSPFAPYYSDDESKTKSNDEIPMTVRRLNSSIQHKARISSSQSRSTASTHLHVNSSCASLRD